MVEKYLIKKSLMKPLNEYFEMKKLRQSEQRKSYERVTFGKVKDFSSAVMTENPSHLINPFSK